MGAGRIAGTVALLLALTPASWGQTCTLLESVQPGDCFTIQLDLKLSGEMRVRKEDKTVSLPLEAEGHHQYAERMLAVAPSGDVQKSARAYESATASIKVDKDKSDRTLRPERRLIVAQRYKDQGLVYSPAGPLTREELELTAGQFDSAAVPGMLAGKAVAVGETWKLPSSVVQALCNFEGLTEHTLTGKLESVTDDMATFRLTGTATGIESGALIKLKIEAVGQFDMKAKRLTSLEWKQKDERDQGPVSPVTTVESTTMLKRKLIDRPEALSDVALVSIPSEETPPTQLTQLDYRDPQSRYAFYYTRDWHITARTEEHLVMRLMDRGDFVAQATLMPWKKADKGQHLTAEQFKETMNGLAGWQAEKVLQAGEVPAEDGRWVYRYSVLGQMDGVTAVQNFYLVAAAGGEQMVIIFSMTPKQVDKLGARDLSLIGGLEMPAGK